MKRILVLGGGFAGVQTAIELQKSGRFRVTLVSERDYLYLYPISIWVPVRTKEFNDVKLPLPSVQKKYPFELVVDRVQEIRAAEQKVVCASRELAYDYLIVAIGADKMKHPGIENTLSICGKPEISLKIRERLDHLVNQGKGKIAVGFGGNPRDKSAVRGGPGFELMFNIHHYLRKKGLRENFELTFFAPMAEPGARMGKNALPMIDRLFTSFGIAKQFGKKITGFEPDGISFEDGSKLVSDLTLFIPASDGHAVARASDLPLSEAGFIRIDDHCQVPGFPNVYAIGDIAALDGPEWTAKQGHIAELMGRNAAYNILQAEKNSPKRKGYQQSLNILCVMDTGNGAAFVFRNDKKSFLLPMPVVGHWMKKGWGVYSKWTKRGVFPRLPGL
ncbi:MAG: FAD-dependent oxidoreductase [Marinilabiliales bacterium]|nr:FAD-dependent oxidoreductase [Marinilabiliales bacterium]